MTTKDGNTILQVVHPICCGMDVHKKTIVATLILIDSTGKEISYTKEFGTMTEDIKALRDWLLGHQCPVVAMESTGIYWRCVHNVLEKEFKVILVNARHIKNVPGRKTDIKDSRWLAGLLRHGLLNGSFIPSPEERQCRDMTRLRRKHRDTLNSYKKRVQKVFETANIKIDSVVSDLFGVTGRNLISLLLDESAEINEEAVRKCAKASLREKVPELYSSIQGFFTEHHRFELAGLMRTISFLEHEIANIDERMDKQMAPHNELIERMDEVPGINRLSALYILSEAGFDLRSFANAEALVSWAGLCPGNNESGGKRKSGRSPVRNHPLKTAMIEVAWSAVRTKGSYYKDKYWRLRSRIGPKRAIVAIAHRIMKALYYIIKEGARYKELGDEYLSSLNQKRRVIRIKREAKVLGFRLVPVESG